MSSFYGNIKFNNQTPLIFDKIYSSRYDMEKNCSSDGIFNGRFILISYGDIQYTPYHRIDPIGTEEYNNLIASGTDLYIINTEAEDGLVYQLDIVHMLIIILDVNMELIILRFLL